MNNLLILGGTGSLGKKLIPKLSNTDILFKLLVHNNDFDFENKIYGDILNKGLLDSQLSEDTVVLNMIGQDNTSSKILVEQNLLGGKNLLESCVKNNVKRIILISTINVYGNCNDEPFTENDNVNPQTFYAMIKSLTEQLYRYYANLYNLNITIIRLGNLYGPDQNTGLISNLLLSHTNPCVISHNGTQIRDFLYIDDAIDGICKVIENNSEGFEIFNICSGKKYSIKKIIQILENIKTSKLDISFSPLKNDEFCVCASNSKAKQQLGFTPIMSLEYGLKKTIFG